MRTWLLIAAERRELEGVLKRFGTAAELQWSKAKFAREANWKGDRWWMIANGPGPRLVTEALAEKKNVNGIISTGFCGALDPGLKLGDVVVSEDTSMRADLPFVRGEVHCSDRVATTAAEKRELRNQTGACAVDMETAAVREIAAKWSVPFYTIRVVSDTASDNLPLDFNRFRNSDGNFSRTRIALAAMAQPFSVMPYLMQFDRNCRRAAEALGDFLADCQF